MTPPPSERLVESDPAGTRVLFLTRGGSHDGAQRQWSYLLRGLDRRRFEPIVAVAESGPFVDALRDSGIAVHIRRMRPWRKLWSLAGRYLDAHRLLQLARAQGVGLIHASDPWHGAYARFLSAKLHVPHVLDMRGPVGPVRLATGRKHALHRPAALIAIAHRYHDDLRAMGVAPDRIHVIDDAVDLEQFHLAPDRPSAVADRFNVPGPVRVGLVGRIEPFKRVVEFLELIAPLAHDPTVPAGFCVIGRATAGAYQQRVRQTLGRLGLADKVVFTGQLDDMPAAMRSLDVLVTMSGGSVMFEAMACGAAVLSVRSDDRHSLHTRHGETALCVTCHEPAPATDALRTLILDANLRRRIGAAGRSRVESHLSIDRMVRQTQEVYDNVLSSRVPA